MVKRIERVANAAKAAGRRRPWNGADAKKKRFVLLIIYTHTRIRAATDVTRRLQVPGNAVVIRKLAHYTLLMLSVPVMGFLAARKYFTGRQRDRKA